MPKRITFSDDALQIILEGIEHLICFVCDTNKNYHNGYVSKDLIDNARELSNSIRKHPEYEEWKPRTTDAYIDESKDILVSRKFIEHTVPEYFSYDGQKYINGPYSDYFTPVTKGDDGLWRRLIGTTSSMTVKSPFRKQVCMAPFRYDAEILDIEETDNA